MASPFLGRNSPRRMQTVGDGVRAALWDMGLPMGALVVLAIVCRTVFG